MRRVTVLLLAATLCMTAMAQDESMPHVTLLDDSNFASVTGDPDKGVLVAFVASWCGHCKRLKPTYEKLAEAFDGESAVDIAMIDADLYRSVVEKYKVSGFPTIKWFGKGDVGPEDYNGGRSLKDLVGFVNEKAGSKVADDGSGSASAGVITGLTDTIKKLVNAKGEEQKSIMESIKEIGATLDSSARENFKYYERVLSKYASDGAEYISKEKARIMKILKEQTNNLIPSQKKSFMKRLNVLNIFSKDEL